MPKKNRVGGSEAPFPLHTRHLSALTHALSACPEGHPLHATHTGVTSATSAQAQLKAIVSLRPYVKAQDGGPAYVASLRYLLRVAALVPGSGLCRRSAGKLVEAGAPEAVAAAAQEVLLEELAAVGGATEFGEVEGLVFGVVHSPPLAAAVLGLPAEDALFPVLRLGARWARASAQWAFVATGGATAAVFAQHAAALHASLSVVLAVVKAAALSPACGPAWASAVAGDDVGAFEAAAPPGVVLGHACHTAVKVFSSPATSFEVSTVASVLLVAVMAKATPPGGLQAATRGHFLLPAALPPLASVELPPVAHAVLPRAVMSQVPLDVMCGGEAPLLKAVEAVVMGMCAHEDVHARACGFSLMEHWLHTVAAARKAHGEAHSLPQGLVTEVLDMVLANWDHPASSVAARMPTLFKSMLAMQDDVAALAALVDTVMGYETDSRARYSALLVVLPRLGADRLLELRPDLVATIMAAAVEPRVPGPAVKFLVALLVDLRRCMEAAAGVPLSTLTSAGEVVGVVPSAPKAASAKRSAFREAALTQPLPPFLDVLGAWRARWVPTVTAFLTTGSRFLRLRAADTVLPRLLVVDPTSVPALLEAAAGSSPPPAGAAALSPADRRLWMSLVVLRGGVAAGILDAATLLGDGTVTVETPWDASGAAVDDHLAWEEPGTVLPPCPPWVTVGPHDLLRAVLHPDDNLRLVAVELVCGPTSVRGFPSCGQLRFMRVVIGAALKTHLSEPRQRLAATLNPFLHRLRAAAATDAQRAAGRAFVSWLADVSVQGLYPGAPIDRVVCCLDAVTGVLSAWGTDTDLVTALWTPDVVTAFMNLTITTWDRIRLTGLRALASAPSPLPGFEDPGVVAGTVRVALRLSSSPRMRECDSGAVLMRLLYAKYVAGLGWEVRLGDDGVRVSPAGLSPMDATLVFIRSVVDVVISRRAHMDAVLAAARGASPPETTSGLPLVHGVLMVARQVLGDVDLRAAGDGGSPTVASWRAVVGALVEESLAAYASALLLIADRTEGDGGSIGSGGGEGPQPLAAKRRVDCRGHLMYDDGLADGAAAPTATAFQFVIVASWMVVKEATLLLGSLCKSAGLPPGGGDDPAATWLLSSAAATAVAHRMFDGLLVLKHPGAIAHTVAAFQAMCEALLAHGSQHAELAAVPDALLGNLLDRVAAAESQFILRRSAGFGKAFEALACAEPGGSGCVLLRTAAGRLLHFAAAGALEGHPLVVSADGDVTWRSRVHAMNILKIFFHHGELGARLMPYADVALRCAIAGFQSPSWAVRNSSTMLFTAVTLRMIRDDKAHGSMDGVHAKRFFRNHPGLHPYLVSALASATASSMGGGGTAMHPSLFPMLLLLSLLIAAPDGKDDAAPVSAFVSDLRRCAALPNAMARVMAARALASMTSLWDVGATLADVVAGLAPGGSTNALHGRLLQVQALVARLAVAPGSRPLPLSPATHTPVETRPRQDAPLHAAVRDVLIRATAAAGRALVGLQWVASPAAVPCGRVREVGLAVFAAWEAVAVALGVPNPGIHVSTLALQRLDAGRTGKTPVDAGEDAELDTCARLAVDALVSGGHLDGYDGRGALVDVLAHGVEAVRVAAAESVAGAAGGLSSGTSEWLGGVVVERAAVESHPGAVRYLVHALAVVCGAHPKLLAYTPATWALMQRLDAEHAHPAVKCSVLGLSGAVVASQRTPAVLRPWLTMVQRGLAASGHYDVRVAALRAVAAAGVVALASSDDASLHEIGFEAWAVVVPLLLDADDEAREAARDAMAAALGEHALPGNCEVTLWAAVAWMVRVCGPRPAVTAWLLAALRPHVAGLAAAVNATIAAAAATAAGSSDADRAVFDADAAIDGYAEPSLMVRVVLGAVRGLAKTDAVLVRDVLEMAVPASRHVLAALAGVEPGTVAWQWFGGGLQYPELFTGALAAWGGVAAVWRFAPSGMAEELDALAALAAGAAGDARLHPHLSSVLGSLSSARSTQLTLHPLFPHGALSAIVPRLRGAQDVVLSFPDRPPATLVLRQEDIHRDVGLTTWPSGVALATHVASQGRAAWDGKAVLELGCGGSPLSSMAASMCGARVVATDGREDVLALAGRNLAANVGSGAVATAKLWWGDADDMDAVRGVLPEVDCIFAADVLYHEEGLAPLAATLAAMGKAGTQVFIAYQVRLHDFEGRFFESVLPAAGVSVVGTVADGEDASGVRVSIVRCVVQG